MKWIRGNAFFWIGLAFLGMANGSVTASVMGGMCWCIPGFAQWFDEKELSQAVARTAVMAVLATLFAGTAYSTVSSGVPALCAALAILAYKLFEGEVSRVRNRNPNPTIPISVSVTVPSGRVDTAQATITQD